MFKRKTLFVLGAGASAEVGLPVGTALAKTIGKKLDIRFESYTRFIGQGDRDLYESVTRGRSDRIGLQHAGLRIRDGIELAQSIDDFLDLHRSDKLMTIYGKAAIVRSILDAEGKSDLYYNPFGDSGRKRFDASIVANTWFVKFMRMLGRGTSEGGCNIAF